MRHREIDPNHNEKRAILRLIGPVVLVVGLLFTIVGVGNFFMAFGSHGPPRLFWCVFVGMPLIAIGSALTIAGFAGAVARYQAGEYAPVAKDTFNYVADGTKDGVRSISSAIGEGLRGEADDNSLPCPSCGTSNEPDSKFCDQCGKAFPGELRCRSCGEENEPDARFCNRCGERLG